jgi:hypothetical protein|uniref:Uncharacterized protein n=1 Tax=viral metagenome TaxID=1070528 RepID=A0A6C0IK88_9ZZZZ
MGSFLSKVIDPDYIDREDKIQEFESSLNDIEKGVNIDIEENEEATWKTLENTVTVSEPTTLFELFFGVSNSEAQPVPSE